MLESLKELKRVSRKVTEVEMYVDTGGRGVVLPKEVFEQKKNFRSSSSNHSTSAGILHPSNDCPFPNCNGLGHVQSHLFASHRSLSDCPHYRAFRKMAMNKNGPSIPVVGCGDDAKRKGHKSVVQDGVSDVDSDDETQQQLSEHDYEWQNILASAARLPAAGQGSRLHTQLTRAIAAVPRRRVFSKLKTKLQSMEKSWKFRDAATNKRTMLQLVRLSGGATRRPSVTDALNLVERIKSCKTSQHVDVLLQDLRSLVQHFISSSESLCLSSFIDPPSFSDF